jgi:hypothetical protein
VYLTVSENLVYIRVSEKKAEKPRWHEIEYACKVSFENHGVFLLSLSLAALYWICANKPHYVLLFADWLMLSHLAGDWLLSHFLLLVMD